MLLQGFSYFLSSAFHPKLGSVVRQRQSLLSGAVAVWNKMKNAQYMTLQRKKEKALPLEGFAK